MGKTRGPHWQDDDSDFTSSSSDEETSFEEEVADHLHDEDEWSDSEIDADDEDDVERSGIFWWVYNLIISTYTLVYPPDGLDQITRELNNEKISLDTKRTNAFLYHPLTLITSFLGLPNGNPTLYKNEAKVQSIGNLFWRFLSWDDEDPRVINVLRAPFAASFHLLLIVPKLVVNIAKLVTEFVPTLGVQIFQIAAQATKAKLDAQRDEDQSHKSYPKIIGWGALYGAAKTMEFAFGVVNFVGRAITSPVPNIRGAWLSGETVGEWLGEKFNAGERTTDVLKAVFSGVFASFTAMVTVGIYVGAAPVLGKLAFGTILPYAPAAIGAAVKAVVPALALVGAAVLTSVIGTEAAAGLKLATNKLVKRVTSWFRKSPAQPNAGYPAPQYQPAQRQENRQRVPSSPGQEWHGHPDLAASHPTDAGMFVHHQEEDIQHKPGLKKTQSESDLNKDKHPDDTFHKT